MNESDYTFLINEARLDRYYGISYDKSLSCINKKVSKSPLSIYRKFSDEMKISKTYIKELHKREHFVLELINRELPYEECDIEKKLADILGNLDDYIRADLYIESDGKEENKKIKIGSKEYECVKRRSECYFEESSALSDVYGQRYEDYRTVYMLKPMLVSDGVHSKWGNVFLFVFADKKIVIKFEIPVSEEDTRLMIENNMMENYSFSVICSVHKKFVFETVGDALLWYIRKIFGKRAVCREKLDNIIISDYEPKIKDINLINKEMMEKIYRIVAAPVPQGNNFDFQKEINTFESRVGYSYSGMKIFCNIMGGCLSIPDEKYIERYKREFEEHGNDIFITEQMDINMEFAIIIVLLKCISSKAMIDKICSGKKSERNFTKLRYEACKSDMMICELEEGCYGSVLDQVEYLEKAMPYFLKKDILNRKNLAIKEMIIAREKRKRENMQQTISVVAFVITFFGGLPYVKDTLKIICDVIPSRFIHIPCEYVNSISVFIWLFLLVLCIIKIVKIKLNTLE